MTELRFVSGLLRHRRNTRKKQQLSCFAAVCAVRSLSKKKDSSIAYACPSKYQTNLNAADSETKVLVENSANAAKPKYGANASTTSDHRDGKAASRPQIEEC